MHTILPTIVILLSSHSGSFDGSWMKCQLLPRTGCVCPPNGFTNTKIPILFNANVINGRIELIEFCDKSGLNQKIPIQNYFRNVFIKEITLKHRPTLYNGLFKFQIDNPAGSYSLFLLTQSHNSQRLTPRSTRTQPALAASMSLGRDSSSPFVFRSPVGPVNFFR